MENLTWSDVSSPTTRSFEDLENIPKDFPFNLIGMLLGNRTVILFYKGCFVSPYAAGPALIAVWKGLYRVMNGADLKVFKTDVLEWYARESSEKLTSSGAEYNYRGSDRKTMDDMSQIA